MISKSFTKILISIYIFVSIIACNVNDPIQEQEEDITKPNATTSWENQKFSMFIHWGIYSIPAGVWKGQKINGYSEQIKGHAKIPTEEYRKLAKVFNPTNWDADSIVLLALKAGMKSIIITAKHHDGFCMFDSKYTQFDIIDASPYKKDILKDLSEACKRNNLKFGVYFSLIDWDYEEAMPFVSVRNSDSIPPLHHTYNLNQIEELLTNYGDISEIWFDMGSPTYNQSREIATLVKEIQPNCMISGRIWNNQGDFVVMGDNLKPDFKLAVPWQTPASMFNETWSYRSWQNRPSVEEKINEKIHDLLSVVSLGGNYLLNIGPKEDGSIVHFEQQVLEGIGNWLKENGEAVYETSVAPIDTQDWGVITKKENKLYLLILKFPKNNKITINGLNSKINTARLVSDTNIFINYSTKDNKLELDLTNIINKDKYATAIVLEYEGKLSYTPNNAIYPNGEGAYILNWDNATKLHTFSGHDYYSTKPIVVKLQWALCCHNNEIFKIRLPIEFSPATKLSKNDKAYIRLPTQTVSLLQKVKSYYAQD
ncbi:MAG: alpha-L-fucosidase [Bacteroidales bacterium]|nr:alpha-L-fucosidase [Bacteroidales bacterium]